MFKRKRISIIYSCISIFVILIVGLAIAGAMSNEKEKFKEEPQISNEEFEKQLFNEKDTEESKNVKESNEENVIEEKKMEEEPIKEESQKNTSNINSSTPKQSQSNTNNNVNQNKLNKNQQTSENNSVSSNAPANNVKQPWEELGISENDYYNKPMWSYATITFKVDDYSSREATENACKEESMRLFNEEQKASACTSVNSYSGRYLGEWLKIN